MRIVVLAGLVAVGCGSGGSDAPDATPEPIPPTRDQSRDILSMDWTVDVTAMRATATIELAADESRGATFEIGDLSIESVTADGAPLAFAVDGELLDIGVPASTAPLALTIEYGYSVHQSFDGALGSGVTLLWPYWCGNLFPCDSDPADGLTVSMALTGVPADDTAVYPAAIAADAPSYMPAWAIGDYSREDLGQTASGISVGVWYLPGGRDDAIAGTAHLVAAIDWFEDNLGPYAFGDEVASVAAPWGAGALGGMEHHPMWHVATGAMASEEVHVHEAAHGWFGNGIRIACWEDFVLSEGTVAYLTARALEATAGTTVADETWASYGRRLARVTGLVAWPDSCGTVDILDDGLFTDAPYMKGAHFYRALERRIGRAALDGVLASFVDQHLGGAAGMQDLLDLVASETGYDPTTCATDWLRSTELPGYDTCPQ